MNNKKTLLIFILVFVLLLGGAYVLYTQLAQTIVPDQLMVQETKGTQPSEVNGTAASDPTDAEATEPDNPTAPDFTVYDMHGNEVHLYDYLGKPIVLNFWASWCGPCQMEMPDFHEKYLELGDEIQFLMINMTDGSRETVEIASAFVEEKGYTFPVLYDTQLNAAMTYGAYSLPTTFFIDAKGHAITYAIGAISGETLQRGIDMIASQ